MGRRRDHYEVAFEDFLRCRDWPYVVVDEAKKKTFAQARIKNFDFIVYSADGPNLLVDVKGRKFPDLGITGRKRSGRAWENWVTREDIEGLHQWQQVFGRDFAATVVFAYWIQGSPEKTAFEDIHVHAGRFYTFLGVLLVDYVAAAKPRSAKWQTLTMPTEQFRRVARDLATLL